LGIYPKLTLLPAGGSHTTEVSMSKIFVRERQHVGTGAGQPRFRVVAVFQSDLRLDVPHLRRAELEQIATATGAEIVYLGRGEQAGEPERGQGGGRRHRRRGGRSEG
jgi:hypothetical protein